MLNMFNALMPYFGGKRKLASQIMKYATGEIFIDGFMGGGSVSLFGKARGFQVISNDKAERSVILGRALIENDDVMIESSDITWLFKDNPADKHFIAENHPKMYTPELTAFLDNARANIDEINDPVKQSVLMLLWMRILLYFRPMSAFGHVNAVEHMLNGGEDVTDTIQKMREHYSRPLLKVVQELASEVNGGIFTNGHENQVYREDVFEFLKHVKGDTVYFDPPYYGSSSYEDHYQVLDDMIVGKKTISVEHSQFNTKKVITVTAELFKACDHIPTIIMSVGRRIIDKDQYIKLLQEYRKEVYDIAVDHTHAYDFNGVQESGKQEVLLVGRAA